MQAARQVGEQLKKLHPMFGGMAKIFENHDQYFGKFPKLQLHQKVTGASVHVGMYINFLATGSSQHSQPAFGFGFYNQWTNKNRKNRPVISFPKSK